MSHPTTHVLRAAGAELIVDTSAGIPRIVHWGAETGVSARMSVDALGARAVSLSGIDDGVPSSALREAARGGQGSPALRGHRGRRDWSPLFALTGVETSERSIRLALADDAAGLSIVLGYELDEHGLLSVETTVTNTGDQPYLLDAVMTWLPLPARAVESIDFTGRWLKERQPQRRPIQVGTWTRSTHEGRNGHDFTIVQLATTSGASFETGEVWALGLAWSGNSRHAIERTPDGLTVIGAGEMLEPGEIELGPGESHRAPRVLAAHSTRGIDGVSARFHEAVRARPTHPRRPRPLTLNVWEAVYFDHSLDSLLELADVAGTVGVERFVLDDGWFGSRRDDTSGLGDWTVSSEAWPEGFGALIERVHARGMEFGLWFEGEMLNPDSDLFREHPEWVLGLDDRMPPLARHQQVLDLAHPDAFDHILGKVDALLTEYPIDSIKWDHNRILVDPAREGVPVAREQVLAIYRLFDELTRRHPRLEIESCSSGGGRIDLGMVDHAHRFWTSDSNDPLERQHIQRYTAIAIPPELLGTHIGPPVVHSSGRAFSLPFRALTALFGHAGLEWDLTSTSPEERDALTAWAAFYRQRRGLLHSGRVVRVDHPDDAALVHGVVDRNGAEALYAYVQLEPAGASVPVAFRLPGLVPEARYRVRMLEPAGPARRLERSSPRWEKGAELTGAALDVIGLEPPILFPGEAFLVDVVRVGSD